MVRTLCLAVVVCGCANLQSLVGGGGPTETPWTRVPTPAGAVEDRLAGACKIPTYSDDYYGFTVGHPPGWRIDYSTGTLMVTRDEKSLVGAILYPVRLRRTDITPDQLAQYVAKGLGDLVRQGGGTFELVDKTTDGRIASGLMLATIDGVRVRGPLQVIETPGFAMLKLYWAPETEMDKEEPTLKQVVACFSRKMMVTQKTPVAPQGGPRTSVNMPPRSKKPPGGAMAAPLQPYQGRFMALKMPAGWKISDETQYGIDIISSDGRAGFGFGWFQNPHERADVYVMQGINQYWPGSRLVNAGFVPGPAGWQIAVAEFEGTVRGAAMHGVVRYALGQGVALSSSWTAAADVWEKVRPTLEAIGGTVEIQPAAVAQVNADIRKQLASYPPVRSQYTPMTGGGSSPDRRYLNDWASQDKRSQQWSDAMLDQERAVSPSTGETYVVPTNAWNPSGPDGPGYYRPTPGGGAERLEQTDPPPQ